MVGGNAGTLDMNVDTLAEGTGILAVVEVVGCIEVVR